MEDPYGLVVKFHVKPGHEQAFDDLVHETLGKIRDQEPGTLIYTCHTVHGDQQARVFYELYSSRAAFEEHEEQPHVIRFLAEREQHLDDTDVEFLILVDGKGLPGDLEPPARRDES